MIIEGHFAGTRSKHYTDRDIEELRDIYRKAYPFIRMNFSDLFPTTAGSESYSRRLAEVEARLERQRVLEAKLIVPEDDLNQMKQFRRRVEQETAS